MLVHNTARAVIKSNNQTILSIVFVSLMFRFRGMLIDTVHVIVDFNRTSVLGLVIHTERDLDFFL